MQPENPVPVATLQGAAKKMLEVELEYGVSLGVWLSLDGDPTEQVWWAVHITGSGEIFDHMPARLATARARVVSAFHDPLAEALWHCLSQLETALFRERVRPK